MMIMRRRRRRMRMVRMVRMVRRRMIRRRMVRRRMVRRRMVRRRMMRIERRKKRRWRWTCKKMREKIWILNSDYLAYGKQYVIIIITIIITTIIIIYINSLIPFLSEELFFIGDEGRFDA